jgi:hypothetical protein
VQDQSLVPFHDWSSSTDRQARPLCTLRAGSEKAVPGARSALG